MSHPSTEFSKPRRPLSTLLPSTELGPRYIVEVWDEVWFTVREWEWEPRPAEVSAQWGAASPPP